MTRRTPKDVAASVRQRLQNIPGLRQDFQYVLIRYATERLLYRLSASPHRDRFVLKGALLFALWSGLHARPTRDADLLGYGESSPAEIEALFRQVCAIECPEDGLRFAPESVHATEIREAGEYGGVRVTADAFLGRARVAIQVDVGFGDAVVPAPVEVTFPTLLDLPPPILRAYSREGVVAEKLEAMLKLGVSTSRMKDFYDVHVLARDFPFGGRTLSQSIAATLGRRHTAPPSETPETLTDAFAENPTKQAQWRAFVQRLETEDRDPPLLDVVRAIRGFVGPPMESLAVGAPFEGAWPPGGPWRKRESEEGVT